MNVERQKVDAGGRVRGVVVGPAVGGHTHARGLLWAFAIECGVVDQSPILVEHVKNDFVTVDADSVGIINHRNSGKWGVVIDSVIHGVFEVGPVTVLRVVSERWWAVVGDIASYFLPVLPAVHVAANLEIACVGILSGGGCSTGWGVIKVQPRPELRFTLRHRNLIRSYGMVVAVSFAEVGEPCAVLGVAAVEAIF